MVLQQWRVRGLSPCTERKLLHHFRSKSWSYSSSSRRLLSNRICWWLHDQVRVKLIASDAPGGVIEFWMWIMNLKIKIKKSYHIINGGSLWLNDSIFVFHVQEFINRNSIENFQMSLRKTLQPPNVFEKNSSWSHLIREKVIFFAIPHRWERYNQEYNLLVNLSEDYIGQDFTEVLLLELWIRDKNPKMIFIGYGWYGLNLHYLIIYWWRSVPGMKLKKTCMGCMHPLALFKLNT